MNKKIKCFGIKPICNLLPTQRCNASCSFCIEKGCFNNENKEEFLKTLKSLNQFEEYLILGGEPTMCDYLDEIIHEVVNIKKKKCFLTTNGSLLHKIDKSILKGLDGLNISIHSVNEKEHNKVLSSVSVNFDDLKEAISKLHFIPSIRINTPLTRSRINSFDKIVELANFAKWLGVNTIKILELQNTSYENGYISVKEIFGENEKYYNFNPIEKGCETTFYINEVQVYLKRVCHFYALESNKHLIIDTDTEEVKQYVKEFVGGEEHNYGVLYPNGKLEKVWQNNNLQGSVFNQ